jgi:uncharacterized protein YidB (DUF937 family)
MDFGDLLKMGASLIQNNSDDATTGLSTDSIADALGSIFGGNSEGGGLDLSSIVGNLTNGNLGEVVSSWIGSGENAPIEPDQVSELLGEDKISEFAEKLGINFDSAKQALADALPNVVDSATNEDSSIFGDLLDKVGGLDGAMDLANKFFKS